MRKTLLISLSTVMMLTVATVAMAADGSGHSTGFGLAVLGMAIGISIAAAGCGFAQGMAVKSACEGIARNPDASNKISSTLILGLAFIESLAIYALLVDLILIFIKL